MVAAMLPRGANPDVTELVCPLGQIPHQSQLQFARRVIGSGFMSESEFVRWIVAFGVPPQNAVTAHTSYVYDKTFIIFAVCEGFYFLCNM